MKLSRVAIKNVKSFKDEIQIDFHSDFNILIGPNGSGKSNLLDIITICMRHFFLKSYSVNESIDDRGFFREIGNANNFPNVGRELEKFYGDASDSYIVFEFIVKQKDIDNINTMISEVDSYKERLLEFRNPQNFTHLMNQISQWSNHTLVPDQLITFTINNNSIQTNSDRNHVVFLQYLNSFELVLIIVRDSSTAIHPNYLYFSPYRGASLNNLQANLSNQSFYEVLRSLVGATSKTVFSLINLATLYFAQKRRRLEDEATDAGYTSKWANDEEVKLVTKYLDKLGYGWNLKLVDKNKNIYEILLTKEGKEFYINQASSGEKEIINFLLGVFAFNLNNGIIVIDEPELHLHPRWQSILLDLFIELSSVTKNQFVISTHSPTFINDRSYNHIFRIYKDSENVSRKVVLKDIGELKVRDVLHIVNSTNNEKIFFADAVILVEGITDRLVFQKMCNESLKNTTKPQIVELVEVKGKTNKNKFAMFLSGLQIPHSFIADLDFVSDIGDDSLKSLFQVNANKVEKDVIKNEKSKDEDSLVDSIENAIKQNDLKELKAVWSYIKSFRRKLKPSCQTEDVKKLDKFINDQAKQGVYILRRGDIEDYFPAELQAKNLDNVIALLQDENFSSWKQSEAYAELESIVSQILSVNDNASEAKA